MIRTLGTEFVHFFLLDQDGEFTLVDALQAMAGHVIARARLDGTYEIR